MEPYRKNFRRSTGMTAMGAAAVLIVWAAFTVSHGSAQATTVSSVQAFQASGSSDQDDMAIWVHPSDTSKTTVIGSDKAANRVFVYDLNGSVVQTLTETGKPGNIDLRYGFSLGGQSVDIVAFNDRAGKILRVFKVDVANRTLSRVDNGSITFAFEPYGSCLYRSSSTGKYYSFVTAKSTGAVEQWELRDDGSGKVVGTRVRSFSVGSQTEGCVADDESRVVYMGEEARALWKYGAEPGDGSTRTAVDTTSGKLNADVEGVTIYHVPGGKGYILVSSQGASEFDVYNRQSPHAYVGTFKVSGTSSTDGIDVTNVNLGGLFAKGMFTAHGGKAAIRAAKWEDIAAALGLVVDTSWNPRGGGAPVPPSPVPTASPSPTPTPTRNPTPTPPAPSCTPLPRTTGEATLTVDIPASGAYTIWTRMMAPDTSNNSYWLKIDGNCGIIVGDTGLSAGSWKWVDYRDGNTGSKVSVSLSSGRHTVQLIGREAGVRIDRLIFTQDTVCVPSGTGDNCLVSPSPSPSPLPSPSPSPTLSPSPSPVPATEPKFEQVVTGTGASTTAVATAPIAGGANQLYVAFIGTSSASSVPDVTGVSGGGLTWTERKKQCSARVHRDLEVWTAYGSPSANFSVTATFATSVPSASASVLRYSNANPLVEDPEGQNTKGMNDATCVGGTDNRTARLTTIASARNSVHVVATILRGGTVISSASAGYTQRSLVAAGSGGNNVRTYVHDRVSAAAGSDSAAHSLSGSNDWVTAGIVIRPAASGTVAGGISFTEDFSSSDALRNFLASGGTWRVIDGALSLTNPSRFSDPAFGNANLAVYRNGITGDFTMAVDALATPTASSWNDFSVLFGYQDERNYYWASFNESDNVDTNGLLKMVNGVQTELANFSSRISAGSWYRIRVEREGSAIRVFRDKTLLATANDGTFASGRVGIGTRNDGATFDNLSVVSGGVFPPQPSPTPTHTSSPTPIPSPTKTPTPTPSPTPIPSPIRTPTPSPSPSPTPTPSPTRTPTPTPTPIGDIATPPNFKVAFIGDSGDGTNQRQVLDLIKREGAQLALHQGDFSYSSGPTSAWTKNINDALGTNFPYLGSDGNHDTWTSYEPFFEGRLAAMGLDSALNGSNYSRTYQGLKLVFTQEGGNPTFIRNELASSNSIWKICSWHKNLNILQTGSKGNEQSVGDYQECLKAGAIIATAHEHTYARTKTLTGITTTALTLDSSCGDPGSVCVTPGKSFVFHSGLGGNGIRNQDRCLPTMYPYGCSGEWAKIYTSDQGAKYGALFITFNVDGNPRKARGYFKNTANEIVDEFTITAGASPIVSLPPPFSVFEQPIASLAESFRDLLDAFIS